MERTVPIDRTTVLCPRAIEQGTRANERHRVALRRL